MKVHFHRLGLCLGIVAASICGFAASASAKDGFAATLRSRIPADAKPGTKLVVTWTVMRPAAEGAAAIPLDATDVFVRLRGPARGDVREAFATFKPHPDGAYRARVTVPRGGIAAVEIGVAGKRTYSNGKSERADLLFPITNPPALTAHKARVKTARTRPGA